MSYSPAFASASLWTPSLRKPPVCQPEALAKAGGEGGIRTRGKVTPTHAFQACSFNHSDTSPFQKPVDCMSAAAEPQVRSSQLNPINSGRPLPVFSARIVERSFFVLLGTLIGLFGRGLGLRPGANAVRRAAAFHLPVDILSQLDVFETALCESWLSRILGRPAGPVSWRGWPAWRPTRSTTRA